jgi:hypothetical protein
MLPKPTFEVTRLLEEEGVDVDKDVPLINSSEV